MTHDEDPREDDGMAERIDALFDEVIAAEMIKNWCWTCQREHQPRERAVPCLFCSARTMDPHAVCDSHRIRYAER